jgi:hypothetical protein
MDYRRRIIENKRPRQTVVVSDYGRTYQYYKRGEKGPTQSGELLVDYSMWSAAQEISGADTEIPAIVRNRRVSRSCSASISRNVRIGVEILNP